MPNGGPGAFMLVELQADPPILQRCRSGDRKGAQPGRHRLTHFLARWVCYDGDHQQGFDRYRWWGVPLMSGSFRTEDQAYAWIMPRSSGKRRAR